MNAKNLLFRELFVINASDKILVHGDIRSVAVSVNRKKESDGNPAFEVPIL
jgi:hypothetical protein